MMYGVANNISGMFLFARLMTAYLYDQSNVADLEDQLLPGRFPHGPLRLDEAYAANERSKAKLTAVATLA